ncbi:MAG TPA: glycosyltransferase family 39 protein [Patescibacteria group bacterium]|nr:glycosyltransferase family 39 protein [Patescibacteria group bacterium]
MINKLQQRWKLALLAAIFLLAIILRLYNLGILPYGLHEDEMMNGYVGRFTLLNGKDLYGNRWPLLYFNNFGDYPPIIPMYLSGISTFIFGVTPFAVRFPIAAAGAIAIIPMYLLGKMLFKKERYALAGAFFLAILPWHILLSRATAENVTAVTAHLFSMYFLFQYLETKKLKYLSVSTILLIAKYFLYATFRVTIPLTMFAAIFLDKGKKWRTIFIILTIFFTLVTLLIGKTPWGEGRFKQTSILYFNDTLKGRISLLDTQEGPGHTLMANIFHNKLVVFTREFIRQYLSYYSPNFLFTDGGIPRRYLLSDTGLLYISFFAFGVLAIFISLGPKENVPIEILNQKRRKLFMFILFTMLVSLIPAAMTLDDVPNVHRTILFGVTLIFPITLVFAYLEKIHWKKISLQGILLLAITAEFVYFWHQYSVHVPQVESIYRGDDRTTLAKYLVTHHNEFDIVYLPHDAKPLYYLFFSNNFSSNLAGQFGPNIALDHVDNLVFIGDNCPSGTAQIHPTAKSLVIDRGECKIPGDFFQVDQVMRIDNTSSFHLLKLSAPKNFK